jgi:putative ABC transport system permease protein
VQPESFVLTGVNQPERIRGANVSYELFRVLGVSPALGRTFTQEEDVPVLGQHMRLSAELFTIVGVMPREFNYPVGASQVEVWGPLGRIADRPIVKDRGNHPGIYVVGRLKPGADISSANCSRRVWRSRYSAAFSFGNGHSNHRRTHIYRIRFGKIEARLYRR